MKQKFLVAFFLLCAQFGIAQTKDSALARLEAMDDEELFAVLDDFLDSMLQVKSHLILSIGAGNRFFNYNTASNQNLRPARKISFTPSVDYIHKSGLGIGISSAMIGEQGVLKPYQFAPSASYDYTSNRKLATGVSYTRFINRDSLQFYTSPLENELYGYFSYRSWWVRPTLSVSYGWGSKTDYEERATTIKKMRLKKNRNVTVITTEEEVSDLNVSFSVRHDFNWISTLFKHDFIRLIPQITLTGGTQRFGFNQTTGSYKTTGNGVKKNLQFNTENVTLDGQTGFEVLAATAYLKSEYTKGKFFLQPVLMFDYFFPASERRFTTLFTINTGLIL